MTMINIMGASLWGGGEQYVYDVCDELTSRGIENYVLVDEHNRLFMERMRPVSHIVPHNLQKWKGFMNIRTLARTLTKLGITVICCHSGKYVLLSIALKKLVGCKLLFFKHNVIPYKTDIYHRWITSQVDAFICVSQLVYDKQTVPARTDKFHMVYNGVNPRRFAKNTTATKDTDFFTLGYAGRIRENKGVYDLIDAAVILHKHYPAVRLFLAGHGTPQALAALQNHITASRAESFVQYRGFYEHIELFYKDLDILVLPSKVAEAFGLVLCEAMYLGIPVLTSRSGAQTEIIEDHKNGYIIASVNAASLALKIKEIYENKEYLPAVIENGKKTVASRFMINETVNKIKEIINHL